MISKRPNVAPLLPVAWEYAAAKGNEPLLVWMAEKSEMP
jgi:hypothetical protein